jgi:hypothetical protein
VAKCLLSKCEALSTNLVARRRRRRRRRRKKEEEEEEIIQVAVLQVALRDMLSSAGWGCASRLASTQDMALTLVS